MSAPENAQKKVAAIQMVSSANAEENFSRATSLLSEAKNRGVSLAVLPENFISYGQKIKPSEQEQKAFISRMSELSRSLDMWVVAGSYPLSPQVLGLASPEGEPNDKHFAACLVFDNTGRMAGHYLKVHLFDAVVGDAVKTYRESDEYYHGSEVACVSGFGRVDSPNASLDTYSLGLAVCYDLRFPELFSGLVQQGARIICVPSAFTEVTGRAHWEVLLRARAIETQCYIIASNQGGKHEKGRSTWGRSMIVSPWGDIISQCDTGEAVVCASLDMKVLTEIRENMPVQQHRRLV